MTNPSLVHEAPLDVIGEHPAVVLDVLSTVGHPLPADPALLEVVVAESTLTEPFRAISSSFWRHTTWARSS